MGTVTPEPEFTERYDVQQTVDFVLQGGYRNVALQFPDELLADSPSVSRLLQERLHDRARVFILADTAYNPLAVDEVAAKHLAADCVIHYGRASLVPVHSLPAFFVLPKEHLDAAAAAEALRPAIAEAAAARAAADAAAAAAAADGGSASASSPAAEAAEDAAGSSGRGRQEQTHIGGFRAVVVLLDQAYQHALGELREALQGDGDAAGRVQPLIFATVPTRALYPAAGRGAAAAAAAAGAASGAGCCAASAASAAQPSCCGAAAPVGSTAAACAASASRSDDTPSSACCGDGSCAAPSQQEVPAAPAGCPPCGAAASAAPGEGTAGDAATGSAAERNGGAEADTAETNAAGAGPRVCTAGLSWSLPAGAARRDCLYVWVGPEGCSAQQVLQLTHSACEWLSCDPAEGPGAAVRRGLSDETRRLLRRRNFVVEKARSANIVGLLVGTLGSAGFLDVISALRRMAAAADKKTYTFLMGKPNPAKLGNFPEVDAFVLVADAQGLILDSRDYLAPLVTPWEAALAFSGRHLDAEDYRMELADVLAFEREQQQQATSAVDGVDEGLALVSLGGLSLATRGSAGSRHEVVARNAAEYLALKRTFKGLEMPATGASPKAAHLAVDGLSGRAAVYSEEGPREQAGGAW